MEPRKVLVLILGRFLSHFQTLDLAIKVCKYSRSSIVLVYNMTSLSISLFLSFFLYVFLSFILSIFLSICLSVFLSFCLSVFLSFCLSVFRSFVLSFFLSFFLHLSSYLWCCLRSIAPVGRCSGRSVDPSSDRTDDGLVVRTSLGSRIRSEIKRINRLRKRRRNGWNLGWVFNSTRSCM